MVVQEMTQEKMPWNSTVNDSKPCNQHSLTARNLRVGESKTNLIINYLPQTMGQDDILSLFSRIAHVDYCKLIRDKITGQSLGYAFVNYRTADGAEKAVAALNGLRLQNKVIKVSYARPSTEAIKGANLYVSGLPNHMTVNDLHHIFAPYGTIINARILTDKTTGLSKGVGFVRYDKRSEAERAIVDMDGKCPPCSQTPITLKFANHPSNMPPPPFTSRDSTPTPPSYQTAKYRSTHREVCNLECCRSSNGSPCDWSLFVYNLGPDTDEATLWQIFGPMGPVKSVKVAHHPQTKKCKGYGFVRMTNYEDAVTAIKALNGATFKNRVLHVSFKAKKN